MTRAAFICSILVLVAFFTPRLSYGATEADVRATIDDMVDMLYRGRNDDGIWDVKNGHGHSHGGKTAMAVLALLSAGESYQNPKLVPAIKWLKRVEMTGTYPISIRLHVWAKLPDEFKKNLKQDARWLEHKGANKKGLFRYTERDGSNDSDWDNSTNQYGMLGLWEASKRGVRVSKGYWRKAAEHFLETQGADGGWTYVRGGGSYGSMTAAGLTILSICDEEIGRSEKSLKIKIKASMERGLEWLNRRFDGVNNPNRGNHRDYYMYGMERVGLATGIKNFGGQDWYEVGADYYIDAMASETFGRRDVSDLSFALMFLARGHVPIWASKLRLEEGVEWNKKPHVMNRFTRWLSEEVEGEVNWQQLKLSSSWDRWLSGTVLFLDVTKGYEFESEQGRALKKRIVGYVNIGGMVVCNPDRGNAKLRQKMTKLFTEAFPDYKFRLLPRSHLVYHSLEKIDKNERTKIYGLSNGVRDLVFVFEEDILGMLERGKPGSGDEWKLIKNIWALTTERGQMRSSVVKKYKDFNVVAGNEGIDVGRVQYEGNWNPEPYGLNPVKVRVKGRVNQDLVTYPFSIEIVDRASRSLKFMILSGVEAHEFKESELKSLVDFARDGGTLLIENVGGIGRFAESLSNDFARLLGKKMSGVDLDSPLITGRGIRGAYKIKEVQYTPYTVYALKPGSQTSLNAFQIGGRPAIIVSDLDLSLGAMGVKRWGVLGYHTDSARKLYTNVVLFAQQQQKGTGLKKLVEIRD